MAKINLTGDHVVALACVFGVGAFTCWLVKEINNNEKEREEAEAKAKEARKAEEEAARLLKEEISNHGRTLIADGELYSRIDAATSFNKKLGIQDRAAAHNHLVNVVMAIPGASSYDELDRRYDAANRMILRLEKAETSEDAQSVVLSWSLEEEAQTVKRKAREERKALEAKLENDLKIAQENRKAEEAKAKIAADIEKCKYKSYTDAATGVAKALTRHTNIYLGGE